MALDETKVNDMLGRFVGDLGATIAAGNVVVGHRLGLYRALAEGPGRPRSWPPHRVRPPLRRGVAARAGRRRLRQLRCGRRAVRADRGAGFRARRAGRAGVSPGRVRPGAGLAARRGTQIAEAFRTGAGVGWHEHDARRPAWAASSSSGPATSRTWSPRGSRRLDGVADKLERAHGSPTWAAVSARRRSCSPGLPEPQLSGWDYHQGSIELARKRAADAGVDDRIAFEVATAQDFRGTGYDLVATFDCLHDMGDPAARRATSGRRWRPTARG